MSGWLRTLWCQFFHVSTWGGAYRSNAGQREGERLGALAARHGLVAYDWFLHECLVCNHCWLVRR